MNTESRNQLPFTPEQQQAIDKIQLSHYIENIPSEGWFKGDEAFQEIGLFLYRHGLKVLDIVQVLEQAYAAVAAEYGE